MPEAPHVQPSLRREQIESLPELGFVERRENVIFLGPPGVGRIHLASSWAIASAQSGRRVHYATLADFDHLTRTRDEVMAAALIDRLVHPCSLVTIRGNGYRMRQRPELWQALHAPPEPDPESRRPSASEGHDDLRLVPSPTSQILIRRNCHILARR